MKPIIGVTANINENQFLINKLYCNAISSADGIPILLTDLNNETDNEVHTQDYSKLLDKIDGLLFTGGGDIHSKFYNEELHPKADTIFEERDIFELELCKLALEKDIPILCICRGIQLLNVALGGTLIQHIENHCFSDRKHETVHGVKVVENTLLRDILKTNHIEVNSIHHQCVGKIGKNATISAISDDDIIEAIEVTNKKFVLGVQWHPETLYKNFAEHYKIFEKFIDFARKDFRC